MHDPSPRYSSHLCVGGWSVNGDADLGSVDVPQQLLARNAKERTCLFRDVCFRSRRDGQAGQWVYFARQGEFRQRRRFTAGVDIWARGNFGNTAGISEDHSFALVREPLPSHVRNSTQSCDSEALPLATSLTIKVVCPPQLIALSSGNCDLVTTNV